MSGTAGESVKRSCIIICQWMDQARGRMHVLYQHGLWEECLIPLWCVTKLTTERRTAKGYCTITDKKWKLGKGKEGKKELQLAASIP